METVAEIEIKTKIEPEVLFKISRMKEVIKATRPHGHKNYFEIILLTAGAGVHAIDLKRLVVKPNSLFFINPGQVHCWEFNQVPKGFVLKFRNDFLLQNNLETSLLARLEEAMNGKQFPEGQLEEILDLIQRKENEFQASDYADKGKIMAAYLQILLLKLKKGLLPEWGEPTTEVPAVLQQFKTKIETTLNQKWQVQDFANELHISAKQLNNLSKRYYFKTASQVITERLALEAKKLLLHTQLTVSEVAYRLGFHDPSHFAKFFMSQTGTSPSRYRIQIK